MSTLFGKPIGQVIKHPGALTAKAKSSGGIAAYCAKGGLDTHSKRQCALARTLRKFHKK